MKKKKKSKNMRQKKKRWKKSRKIVEIMRTAADKKSRQIRETKKDQ